jgi:hypothetical protein
VAPEDSLQAPTGVSSVSRPPSLARYFILNLYGDLYALYEKTSQLRILKKKKLVSPLNIWPVLARPRAKKGSCYGKTGQ